jgi:rhodanese-related sulfurtransferase
MKNKYLYFTILALAILGFIYYFSLHSKGAENLISKDLSPEVALQTLQSNKQIMVLDVRTPAEYVSGHLAGALNVDWDNPELFKSEVAKLDKNAKYFLYCRSGNRSSQALNYMQTAGFTNVYNILGGTSSNKLPLVQTETSQPSTAEKVTNTDVLQKTLDLALLDEYKARNFYRNVISKFGQVKPFINIIKAEEKHIASLLSLYQTYNLKPALEPVTEAVQLDSVPAACATGVQAEIDNAALYRNTLLPQVAGYSDVTSVFTNLMNASQDNHLPAFQRCAK